jgi:hypothetical protein
MKSGSSAKARALAARQLVRIAVDESDRQSDQIKQGCRAIAPIAPSFQASVHL